MNKNNQPQSQQTKREPGYYWVKMEGFQWRIAGWNGSEWTVPGSLSVFGDDWFEIDERRIERSHSPTEQPGDVGFNKLVMDTFHELYPFSSGPHLNELFVIAERASKYERSKQAELVAENARLKAECSSHEKERYEIYSFDSSQAMEIKALQKELEQLRSERDKMREENSNLKKELQQYHDSINPEMQP